MRFVHIIAVILTLASTLAPCFASVINPKLIQSRNHVLESLTAVTRQSMCDSKAECNSEESCVTLDGVCETTGCDGFCLRLIRCSCTDPCDGETTCILLGESDGLFLTACIENFFLEPLGDFAPPGVPCEEAPNNSDGASDSKGSNSSDAGAEESELDANPDVKEAEGVCIGVDLLQEFASHQLVFENHAFARVLCDTYSSCATEGHIVNYRGRAMMMGTYCNIVGCVRKVMKVNSPKYQRGLKVPSRSVDMYFTAFAARYGTRAEEGFLAAVVRAGF